MTSAVCPEPIPVIVIAEEANSVLVAALVVPVPNSNWSGCDLTLCIVKFIECNCYQSTSNNSMI